MEEAGNLRASGTMAASESPNPNPGLPSKTREEGELSSSSDDEDENCDSSAAQSIPAAGSDSAPLAQKSAQPLQSGSSNVQLQTNSQSPKQKILKKNQLPPKSSLWTSNVGTDKNLVISFSDDDSGSDIEGKGNASKLDSTIKRPSTSLEKSNKLQQNARILHKEMPKRSSLSRTFNSSMTKVPSSISKGAGSMLLLQGSRTRNFNPTNKVIANRERGPDQGVSNDNKLQDLRHQIALRESELKLKAAQQNKEYASVLGRDHNGMNTKNNTARKNTPVSSGHAQLEQKEPDRKRMRLASPYCTPQTVGGQQEVTAVKSILPPKDSTTENYYPQETTKVDHSPKVIPGGGESTIIISEKQPDKHLDNSLENMPCRSRDGDVNYGYNQAEKSNGHFDPCVAFNQNAVPAKMSSNSVPKNFEALSNAVLLNHNGNVNFSEHSNMDVQSAFSMEELIDKELEEAQEHRHKCEIEERNALKAYLKAQRSLLEANARCTNLYHKRELYSAKLRSMIINNSGFSWSSGQNQHLGVELDYLPRLGYEIPTSSCQRQDKYNDINNPSFDSNNEGTNNRNSNMSNHHKTGANLGSKPCGEPDASISEPLPQRDIYGADVVYSPSDEIDTSANENEETSLVRQVSDRRDAEYHRQQGSNAKLVDIDTASNANFSTDNPQDSLLLEASLRSELFARFGARSMKNSNPCNDVQPAAERGAENEVGNENALVQHGVFPLSRVGDNDLKGIENHERSIYVDSSEIQSQLNIGGNSSNVNCNIGSEGKGDVSCQCCHSTNTLNISPMIFRSAFSELKEMFLFNSDQLESKNTFVHTNDGLNGNATSLTSDETTWSNMLAPSIPVDVGSFLSDNSSFGYSPAVDPFWPLCMYELRGKCNNDECPWQHAKDYNDVNSQHTDSNNADGQGRLPLHQQNCNDVAKVPRCHKATIMPTYLVGLDILKADQFAYKPVISHTDTQCWQKHFSITLATSNLQHGLQADGPLLQGGGERIEVQGAWNKQLSSFHWRSGAGNHIKQALADSEQAVEMALLILSQEINKSQGVRKALSVLSKALESDPTSVVLWIVYLVIYYGNLKPNEKDDMFLYAVKLCEGSYVLWLMYINSRGKLDDRFVAYDTALSVLCQHAPAAPKDHIHESSCILDLFLQMMDCLCVSGNAEKAIERIYEILPATTKSNEPHHVLISEILNCLTTSDKCVFWVCCVYLVVYRKLPGAVVQQFECEKDLFHIEWSSVILSEDDKEMAIKLVETAVESIDSSIYNETVKSDVDLRYAQLFALNHLRCVAAFDSRECLRNLLDKYLRMYPSCIELVLASARLKKKDIGVDSFVGFEEAISRWPKELPGIQCIWNQYIEYAIHNQRIDLAKTITVRWFHSVWQVQDLRNDGANSSGSLELDSKSVSDGSNAVHKPIDRIFGFLNLSLYKFFQNDKTAACSAVDKARISASFGGLEECVRKHVMFLVFDALRLMEDGPDGSIKKILELYMDGSSQALLIPKLLTRKSFNNIKRPRVQHLIGNMLSPVSSDCSLLNLILQSWFGASLVPQTVSDPKHLVDFVEAIMVVVPHNFQLAITICKLLVKDYNSSDLNSACLWFWACSTLVNAMLSVMPIPPEHVWVEAAGFLQHAIGIEAISERFYRRALSVYPFSIKLWKCFCKLYRTYGDAKDAVEAAKERGIKID